MSYDYWTLVRTHSVSIFKKNLARIHFPEVGELLVDKSPVVMTHSNTLYPKNMRTVQNKN